MTERFVTLVCALGALLLFLLLFVNPEQGLSARQAVARPTTEETQDNGYHAAYEWVRASGIRAVSLRERFNTLARRRLAARGNVLLVSLPGTEIFRLSETKALQRWIHSGNTLIVLAALADAPDWATAVGGVNVGDLRVLSGLDFTPTSARPRRTSDALTLLPNRTHAYFTDVGEAVAAAQPARSDWRARVPYEGFMLALAHERASGAELIWSRFSGDGRIVVVGAGSLFSNRGLALAGNAQLFANMIRANLGPGGAVVFDDYHQGLSSAYDPAKFYRDPRLYMTIAALLALWFAWVLGSTRLRIAPTLIAAPREADLVRTSGGFLARVLGSDVAAQRLFEYFFHRLRLRAASQSANAWELLDASARVSASELAQLRHWHTQAYQGERVPLVRLYNLILAIDRQIA